MATLDQLGTALRNAHNAGDEQAARRLATEIKRMRVSPPRSASENESSPQSSGMAMNVTAGINEGLYGTLGAPVDAVRGAINLGIQGVNAATGTEIGQLPDDSFMGSRWIGETLGSVSPALDPQNTIAATEGDRIARGVGQGVGYTVAPAGAVGALSRGGQLSGKALDTATKLAGGTGSVGSVAANAGVGGVAGGSSMAAMENAPEEWKPVAGLAGGLVGGGIAAMAGTVPGIAREGSRAARNFALPMSAGGREQIAGGRIRNAARDPEALREMLDQDIPDLVPGSKPTTFQATGDMGIGELERGAATKYPGRFGERRATQNAARVDAVTGVQKVGAPEQVAGAVRARLAQIDEATQSMLDEATEAARTRTNAIGQGRSPEDAGDVLRGSLEAARAQAKASESTLWQAVDPDGTLMAPASKLRAQALKVLESMPSTERRPSGEEADIFSAIGNLGEVAPFSDIAAMRSRLSDALKIERRTNGETRTYRRLSMLRGALEDDLSAAISTKVAQEADAVAAGQMEISETLFANLQKQQEVWFADRQATARSADGGGIPGGYGAGGQASVPGVRGAGRQARGEFRAASRDPRLAGSEPQPNFDEAARERLTAATTATRERAGTFDNRQLGPLRRRPAQNAPYDVPASAVPGRVFVPGARGFETIQTYRNAVGDDEAFTALRDFATDRLRQAALRDDGTLDPAKVTAWRRVHADALRAFPDLDAQFADAATASDAMATVARQRKTALDEAQRSVLGKFVGVDHPDDVTSTIGRIFGAQDTVKRMAQLRSAIQGDADAEAGLRKAIVDHITTRFVGNTEAGTSGVGTVKSDGFQTFVKQNRSALRTAGFSDDELTLMGRVAEDLQRANRSVASVKNPGGSNTAQDLMQVQKEDSGKTVLAKVIASMGAPGAGAGAGFAVGGGFGAAAGAVGAGVIAEMRRQGLEKVDDLIADALLNPGRARVLLSKAGTPKQEEGLMNVLARLYRQSAVPTVAVSTDPLRRSDLPRTGDRRTGARP
ncbi:hypothetical protein U0C82_18555 [Fulvimarina sp. 2208YS6-2-32]|uniref:Uncharacterized protein n=1 Tax=Fulvimarina uroteuthidis TaxID=3098149 RepID=A0ABU5IA45_9HYPH|nr:hypothetical protein [Fulvimarina sp. 2208YS6-2-32]MDY8111126.1 hypothetical protein [Fulvimarina sp. 2208YS6-2-32]